MRGKNDVALSYNRSYGAHLQEENFLGREERLLWEWRL